MKSDLISVLRGGERVDDKGYLRIRINGKYAEEHRLIWEYYNEACLLKWSVIHHKNGNKLDNRPENLEAMLRARHNTIHRRPRSFDYINRRCFFCELEKRDITKKGFMRWYKYFHVWVCHTCYGTKIYKKPN